MRSEHNALCPWRNCVVMLVLAGLSACSLAPVAVRDSARSLNRGEVQVDTGISPNAVITAAYGVTDKLDVGIDIETTRSIWSRYSFLQADKRWSLAGTAAIFKTDLDSYDDVDPGNVNGGYLGLIASRQMKPTLSWNLAYRYNYLDYQEFRIPDKFLFDELYYNDNARQTVFVSSEDLRGIGQISATATILVRSHFRLVAGAGCQINHTKRNPDIRTSKCAPILGFAFNQR